MGCLARGTSPSPARSGRCLLIAFDGACAASQCAGDESAARGRRGVQANAQRRHLCAEGGDTRGARCGSARRRTHRTCRGKPAVGIGAALELCRCFRSASAGVALTSEPRYATSIEQRASMKALQDLQLFVRAAKASSLSAAARGMDISPAAASLAVKRLEAELDVQLMVRSTRSLRLTNDGELFLRQCEQALDLLTDACDSLSSGRKVVCGQIQLSAPSDLGRNLVLPWLH